MKVTCFYLVSSASYPTLLCAPIRHISHGDHTPQCLIGTKALLMVYIPHNLQFTSDTLRNAYLNVLVVVVVMGHWKVERRGQPAPWRKKRHWVAG